MKKIIIFVLAVVLAFGITGCDGKKELTGSEQLAADTVTRFMEERGESVYAGLLEESDSVYRPPQVVDAMDYSCSDYYGYRVEYLYINLLLAEKENGNKTFLRLCLDKNTNEIYDFTQVTSEFCKRYYEDGERSPAIVATMSTGSYSAFVIHGGKNFYSDNEIKSEFTNSMLNAVNSEMEK